MADKKYDLETMAGRISLAVDSIGQSELARRTGISLTQLHRITKGANTTIENVIKIAVETQFNLQWLAFGEGPQQTLASVGLSDSDFVEVQSYRSDKAFSVSFFKDYLNELGLNSDEVLGWHIDVETKISQFKKGDDVLISPIKKTGTGFFVLKLIDQEVIALIEPQLNGSFSIKTDDKKPAQQLTEDQYSSLDIVGKIVWPSRSE